MKEDRQKTSYICINFKNEKIADLEAHVNPHWFPLSSMKGIKEFNKNLKYFTSSPQ